MLQYDTSNSSRRSDSTPVKENVTVDMANLQDKEDTNAARQDEGSNKSENEEPPGVDARRGGSDVEGDGNEVEDSYTNEGANIDPFWPEADMRTYGMQLKSMSAEKSSSKTTSRQDTTGVSARLFHENDEIGDEKADLDESQEHENEASSINMEDDDDGEDEFDEYWGGADSLPEDVKARIRNLDTIAVNDLPFHGNIRIYCLSTEQWFEARHWKTKWKKYKPFADTNCGRCLVKEHCGVFKAYYRKKDVTPRNCCWEDHEEFVESLPGFTLG